MLQLDYYNEIIGKRKIIHVRMKGTSILTVTEKGSNTVLNIKGRYPKDNDSGRTTSHGEKHMKRGNMNTQSQHKSPIKKRRK